MNYYELRSEIAKIIPRQTTILSTRQSTRAVKEKGRKSHYKEFKIPQNKFVPQERLLDLNEVNSFVEVSCRAAACPMPLNLDVWDGLHCPFGCIYCFANAFRASLYTSFFDNSKEMGLRHCDPNKYQRELDKILRHRDSDPHDVRNPVAKAIAMQIPMRFGIRFEDFPPEEAEKHISLQLLQYLAEHEYPVMVNTKSDLIGTNKYVKALSRNRSAVHMTLISSNNKILQALEPGAPSYEARLNAMEILSKAGVQVVARIEPYLVFINDHPDDVTKYIEEVWDAGVRHITFDTYSYTAKNPGIPAAFRNAGYDWYRTFLIGCDSQALGSLLLGEFMNMFRKKGFKCSTFDMGNVPDNHDAICCEVGYLFDAGEYGFNYGCSVMAARFIQHGMNGQECSWSDFSKYVNKHGGFLSTALECEVHELWNFEGTNDAYGQGWARGIIPVGYDEDGIVWKYQEKEDFRRCIYDNIIGR